MVVVICDYLIVSQVKSIEETGRGHAKPVNHHFDSSNIYQIQNLFLTALNSKINRLYQCQSNIIFFVIIQGHTVTTYPGRVHFYDITRSGRTVTTYPGLDAVLHARVTYVIM